jgi:steroid delta-isomerase-like uncharacterized protein
MGMLRETAEARLKTIEAHVRSENLHNLDAVMATLGQDARYDDEPWGEHRQGRVAVRSYYEDLLRALPDLRIEVKKTHVTEENTILELEISGTHMGPWRGVAGTGRSVRFPLCAVYSFDSENKLAGERIYYDRATPLGQIGLFHEPSRGLGRIATVLSHPLTMGRAFARMLGRRNTACGATSGVTGTAADPPEKRRAAEP